MHAPPPEPQSGRISVGVFAPSFPPAYRAGGPVRSIDALVQGAPARYRTLVLAPDTDMGFEFASPVVKNVWLTRGRATVRYVSLDKLAAVVRAFRSMRKQRPTLLYLNGFFNVYSSILPVILWRFHFWGPAAAVLAPRGEFGAGALTRHPLKKRVYMIAFRLLGLKRQVVWHATAEHEVQDIREIWGPGARILLRENDTQLPLVAERPSSPRSDAIKAVFLGRIVEHKGLAIVLDALRRVSQPLTLDVYGSEEDERYARECRRIAATLPNALVKFHGPLAHEEVRRTLSGFDVLLMPTAGENFGHVIAEALSVSCAVMTTPWTPWTDVLKQGGGTVVADRTPSEWASAVEHVASLSRDEIALMRLEAARKFDEWRSSPSQAHLFDLAIALGETARG
jgi:glycosyltransferase involved in cell wall biosynthesis